MAEVAVPLRLGRPSTCEDLLNPAVSFVCEPWFLDGRSVPHVPVMGSSRARAPITSDEITRPAAGDQGRTHQSLLLNPPYATVEG